MCSKNIVFIILILIPITISFEEEDFLKQILSTKTKEITQEITTIYSVRILQILKKVNHTKSVICNLFFSFSYKFHNLINSSPNHN